MTARPFPAGARPGITGFTLMETLVMLLLVSMAATMMFQMLESYRIAQQRIAAQAGNQDRSSLFEAWLIDGVHGLMADPGSPFKGSRLEFEGITLNPLFGPSGTPTAIHWKLAITPEAGDVSYSEAGVARWTSPLRNADGAHFVYFTSDGSQHDRWPPALGLQGSLPAEVALVLGSGEQQRVRLAVVQGPLVPRVESSEPEPE